MGKLFIRIVLCSLFLYSGMLIAQDSSAKKILFINSYHAGYEWSDGITTGIQETLKGKAVSLDIHYMDSKRQRSAEAILLAAQKAREAIEQLQPDLVITADDNAAKHIIAAYYKDAALPFVFCGVNWDASVYGFPYSNVTGMEEVSLISSIVKQIRKHAKGDRLGLLSINAISGKLNVQHFVRTLGREFDKVCYVDTYQQWQACYRQLQQEVDMLVLENPKGITGWENEKARQFVEAESKIPSGSTHVWLAPYVLLAIAKIPQEQGRWAAQTALKILDGMAPAEIPIVKNREGKLFINLKLANKMGITFSPSMIETAEILR